VLCWSEEFCKKKIEEVYVIFEWFLVGYKSQRFPFGLSLRIIPMSLERNFCFGKPEK
jgi:hypothetical protein